MNCLENNILAKPWQNYPSFLVLMATLSFSNEELFVIFVCLDMDTLPQFKERLSLPQDEDFSCCTLRFTPLDQTISQEEVAFASDLTTDRGT